MSEISKFWSAPRRRAGEIVYEVGELVYHEGDKIALMFEGESRPRWYPFKRVTPTGDEFVSFETDSFLQGRAEEAELPPLPDLIGHKKGKKLNLQVCCYLDEKHPVKAEKAEYVDGNWEVLVRGRGIATAQVKGAKPTQRIERLWVIWQRLTAAPVPGKIDFTFKGEVTRRTENYGMASHRQRHYKFLDSHQYHKKVRVSPTKVKEPEPLEKGWQQKLPEPYVIFGGGPPVHGWVPKNLEKIQHPIPARGGGVVFACHEQENPAFVEMCGGVIPPEHEAEKMRAARAEKRMLDHNKGRPVPSLDERSRFWMARTKELVAINDKYKVVAAKVVWEEKE